MDYKADIGILGGSGFYSFFNDAEEIQFETPYGFTSDVISITEMFGKKIAFIPRHGRNHQYPPHKIPYQANIYAMKQLGVKNIIAPTASGSLQAHIKPGDFVICDQFIDRTWGRLDTYFDGPIVKHISPAHPYCPNLRNIVIKIAHDLDISVHEKGTIVVIQGPRFSTKAESRWFNEMNWDVINMTQYPEVVLAKEMEICYVNISLITDYDAGLEGRNDILPVTEEEVYKVFNKNNKRVKQLIISIIKEIDIDSECSCFPD